MLRASRASVVLALLPLACSGATSAPGAPEIGTKKHIDTATPPERAAPARTALSPTRREDVVETIHGVEVLDPYRWLEEEKAPEVRAWMKDRDAHTRAYLTSLPRRTELVERYKKLLYVEQRTAPIERASRLFYSRKPADQEKSIHYWQEGERGAPQVLLDPNTMSADGTISVDTVVPSWDGKKVAYMEKQSNADESTLRVIDVGSGALSAIDVIRGLRYTEPSWLPDASGFFYTWLPDDPSIPANQRMAYGEIRFHALGTDPARDPVVREKTGDPERWQSAWASRDGKYLFATVSRGWSEQDVYVRFLKEKKPRWHELAAGTKSLYTVAAHEDVFYVATNQNAPRWKVYRVDPRRLARKEWKEIIPEDGTAVLDDVAVIGGHLALRYLRSASTELEIRTLAGKMVRQVPLPALGTASSLVGDATQDTAYFSFSSFTYPEEIYRTQIATGETSVFARVEAPVSPGDFEVEQAWYPSKDGTKVSIFLVQKKGLHREPPVPALLYGYGGFNIALTPAWRPLIIPWLERGGIFAVANLRGGGEYGEEWHKAGMLANKQNVFDDFIAAAEWLIRERYTAPRRLAIQGGSNGGLLVGAAMTQRPDLFGAVICAVPLLDMVRYHRFGIGRAWIPEYGSADDGEAFRWLHAYSPYHRLKSGQRYPALLMLTADGDDRVDPMHARKFHAALESAASEEPLNLIRIEMNAGHGGADMRKEFVEKAADQMVFLYRALWLDGLDLEQLEH